MKDFWEEVPEKKINKKKIVITILIFIAIVICTVSVIIYRKNMTVREWVDKNIFRKEIEQNNLPYIEIENMDTSNICCFNKYIGILNKSNFNIYDNFGKKVKELNLEISEPIYNASGRYLVAAEEKGQKLYLIEDREIVWSKVIDGNISDVIVNKNGYVAVTIVDTSYKTVVKMFDSKGEALFTQFLSTTRVTATSISNDNKYLAIAEVDTSGVVVQSSIRVISIEAGKNDSENSIKDTYVSDLGELIINLKYQERNQLVCLYEDKIVLIKNDGSQEVLQDFKEDKAAFASVGLANSVLTVLEKASGIFTADSIINIMNSDSKSSNVYTVKYVIKDLCTSSDMISLNLGTEVIFLNSSGWVIKKYVAAQEINKIVLSDSLAGIVYRDKIELISL